MKQTKANQREVQKAETRTLILKSARQVFKTQDYDKVIVRGVAALALMSNYFFVLTDSFLRDKMADPDQLAALLETLVDRPFYN